MPSATWGFLLGDPRGVRATSYLLAGTLVSGIAYAVFSAGIRCPLCHGPLLRSPRCARSPKARRLFRSYRLGVATDTLLLGHFRCPCCGEPCRCTTEPRR